MRPPAAVRANALFRALSAARVATTGAGALFLLMLLPACSDGGDRGYQGYVEGDFVYAGASIAGRVASLAVKRGDSVAEGAPLFTLEADNEAAQRAQADAQLKAAQATLADIRAGKRVPEVDITRAQLAEAQAAERKTAMQVARDEAQYRIGGIARAQLDDSRAAHDADVARVHALESQVTVATLPNRDEQVHAQAAQVAAAQAVVDQAAWRERQTRVLAPRAARVEDTLFQPGEFVAAGLPVVKLLPPENLRLRFFVPEPRIGALHLGDHVSARCDGCAAPVAATVSFIATRAEFTPPIIYSNDTRAKLVYMIEARPDAAVASSLRPGQPVAVTLP